MLALLVVGLNSGPVRAEEAGTLNNQQIEQMVAPIALYPDPLISQILMAATYPLEVVEAARWSKENPKVTGQALEDAMQKQSWDPSVKALTAVPETLAMMNDQLKWTQDLGDAFLAQQSDVLDAVQRLRARADAAGNLKTTPQQKVVRTNRPAGSPAGAPAQAYVIEPTNPNEYYVPIYDPGVVYGAWPYETYRPFYWYPPGYVAAGVFGFATAAVVGAAIWGNVNWWNRRVGVNVNRYNSFNRTRITSNTWSHNAAHRHGVAYNNPRVAQQFGGGRDKQRDAARQNLAKGGMGGMGDGGMGGMGGMGDGGMGGMGQGGMGGMGEGGMGAWAAWAAWVRAEWVAAWPAAEWEAAGAAWVAAAWVAWPVAAEWAAARRRHGWRNGRRSCRHGRRRHGGGGMAVGAGMAMAVAAAACAAADGGPMSR